MKQELDLVLQSINADQFSLDQLIELTKKKSLFTLKIYSNVKTEAGNLLNNLNLHPTSSVTVQKAVFY